MKWMQIASCIILSMLFSNINAQYFGRNKPRYRTFDFKILETPAFDLHYYSKNRTVVDQFANWAEMWYDYHKDIVGEEFSASNPIILYNNHAEFQQTNAITGDIGVGTGGVTEAFKNRVIMPFTHSNQQTMQVLGHELVHAFQFNSILNGDSTNIQSLANLDLFMVEGMAEYMTLGRIDPFTSMWMRDAIVNDKVPTLSQMRNPRYFPYRYGQAMWSVLTGIYGDQVIKPFFKATAIFGLEYASQLVFEKTLEDLSKVWVKGLTDHYTPYLRDKKEKPQGKVLFNTENSGNLNVSPSISPNGRYVVFLSEKDLFSTDLYLADIRKGKILNKVASLIKDGDLDNFNFLESSGTWSPNGKDFAFVGFKQGRNVLVIKDAEAGKTLRTEFLPGLSSFANPVWSPDGKFMIVAGLDEGQPDLYKYDLKSKRIERLTDDTYSEILPNFNKDGTKLTFSYDKRSMTSERKNGHITYDIAVMDMGTREIDILDVFHGAENLNPNFDQEGNIYFISERDGFRNIYRYISSLGEVHQMTDLLTGVSGISRYSPALTVSTSRDQVVYNHYFKNGYALYEASLAEFLNKPVDAKVIEQTAGTLPVIGRNTIDVVNKNIREIPDYAGVNPSEFKVVPYRPRFKLDMLGGGVGAGVGTNLFGTANALQGGVYAMFSDLLGNNQVFTQISANGEIFDVAGQVRYTNFSRRLNWGIGLTHFPTPLGYREVGIETLDIQGVGTREVINQKTNLVRIFEQNLSTFVQFPFSTTKRVEASVSGSFTSFRGDAYNEYYLPVGNQFQFLGQDRTRIDIPDTLSLGSNYSLIRGAGAILSAAFVGDNSYFGVTSPLAGYRYRFGVDKVFGVNDYTAITADYRKYWRLKPITIAARATSNIRFENRVNSVLPYFVGQMGFVRGFGTVLNPLAIASLGNEFDQLLGSKIAVSGAEIRLPFLGPRRLAIIPSNFLLVDLNAFVDIGTAFNKFDQFTTGREITRFVFGADGNVLRDDFGVPVSETVAIKPLIARTAGFSARVNVMGYLVVEPYYAWQLTSGGGGRWGFNIIPGW